MYITIVLCIFVSCLFAYVFYKWATKNQDYFVKNGIKHLKPNFLFGNTLKLYLNRYPSHAFLEKLYNSYPNEKLIGFFDFKRPMYMARDAELINQIAISKFNDFVDHGTAIDVNFGVLYEKSVFSMRGSEWRAMRPIITSAFTRSKLRSIFYIADRVAQKLVQNLAQKSQKNDDRLHLEMTQLFANYTADITASCFFGLDVDSSENLRCEFIKNAADGINFSGLQCGLRVMLLALCPKLMQAIDFGLVPRRVKTFFKSIVFDVMEQRSEKQIYRPDLINTLMEIRNKRLEYQHQVKTNDARADDGVNDFHWTDDELVAQFFIICISSINPIAATSAYMAYELALNRSIQQKLYDEIRTMHESLDGQPWTFDALEKLKYLDQVIDETLRKYPASPMIIRKCTKDTELDLGDGKMVSIERDMNVWFPIASFHSDPRNFVDPKRFDPDRFNETNKPRIKVGSYIPFGVGPRMCIGHKFVLMASKVLLVNLLLSFCIEPYEATQIPLEFANTVFLYKLKNGIHLELKSRTQTQNH